MISLYNEDCLEGMKRIPSGSVDMILTDPPFGTTSCDWDVQIPLPILFEQFWRVAKSNAAVLVFSQMPSGAELIMSQKKLFRYEWIWEKDSAAGFLNANKMPLRCHELILVFYRKLPTYNPQYFYSTPYQRECLEKNVTKVYGKKRGIVTVHEDGRRYPRDLIKFNIPKYFWGEKNTKAGYPTQKPVDLLEYLIRTYTNEGELVLDATMGSGSTGVAAVNVGRRFIGFETEQKFFDIAQERINKVLAEKESALF